MNLAAIAELLRDLADELDPTPETAPPPVPVPVASKFDTCLAFTIRDDIEGGFSNNPADPGGATNHGVTLTTFRHFAGPDATVEDLKAISSDMVAKIYKVGYWDTVKGDQLPAGLDLMVFDMGVNSGPGQSVKLLQRVCGADEDGIIGPATLAAISGASLPALHAAQEAFYRSLHNFATFGKGWLNRLNKRYTAALAMVTKS